MNQQELRIRVLLTLQAALLGEISTSIRGVACCWDSSKINIFAFFDHSISEDDQDSMESVTTQVMASFPEHQVDLELIRIDYPNPLNIKFPMTLVYLRKENIAQVE